MAPTLLSLDITPKTPADQQKLALGLQVLAAEDVELLVSPGIGDGCTTIGTTGEAHLERIVDRLRREFEVEAAVGKPTVAYVETVTRSAVGNAKHVAVAQGRGEYAHVSVRLHPGEAGSGCRFEDRTVGGSIPSRFMASIDQGIRDAIARGVLSGHPVVDVRVEVHDGSYHDTDSTDAAFRTAAAMAFVEAAGQADPVVMEPVMQVVVRADSRYVGVVLESLRLRRAEVQPPARDTSQDVVTARVPLSELFGFETHLRVLTHGHASCSIDFAGYQPLAPGADGDDENASHVGVPRRPAPTPRTTATSVPEPDDDSGVP